MECCLVSCVQNSSEVHANAAETLSAVTRIAPSALASKLSGPKYVLYALILGSVFLPLYGMLRPSSGVPSGRSCPPRHVVAAIGFLWVGIGSFREIFGESGGDEKVDASWCIVRTVETKVPTLSRGFTMSCAWLLMRIRDIVLAGSWGACSSMYWKIRSRSLLL